MYSSIRQLGRRGRLPPSSVPRASATDQATDCRIRPAFASGRAVRRDGVGPAAGGRDNRAPGSLRNLVRVLLTELAHPISPLLWKKSLSQTQSKNQQALFSWQHMLHVMRLKSGRAFLEEQPSDAPAMARRDVVICPELEHKPTLRRHRGCAAFDPQSGPRIGLPSWMQAVRVVKIAQTSSSD